ncbi:alpha/beta hydrolase [Membranihabitans marinus]|uniref:alpha/beta hydrolase n=1 Tax=Membranihabitans marinus TaxID=1227546 RepID=UPI001F44082F|nr:alpha/beta hydrolase-fold protein [Membranihabitans marinus]
MKFSIALIFFILFGISESTFAQSMTRELSSGVQMLDEYHYSHSLSANRSYRIFLPPNYEVNSDKKYPVIYYFHGWAQRYFGSMGKGYANYDKGDENNGDNIEKFVSENDVIVVKVDGLNNFSTDPLNLSPYNVSSVTTFRQFPNYFLELIDFIDSRYRTIPDREHRAVSGLSMGGFMTFWLSAKFPDKISAAGNFCGSTEFSAGLVEYPVVYTHAEMYDNYKATHIRMNNGTRDRLRFYHEDMNRVLLNVLSQYEFHVYEASHVTCGLGDMFDFLMKAFESPLPLPERWDYIDIYPFFEVWDYKVETDRNRGGFTILENVDEAGFNIAVRNFLPDGQLMTQVAVKVITAPLYQKNTKYYVVDVDLRNQQSNTYEVMSDNEGRLAIVTTGSQHQISIAPNTDQSNLSLANFSLNNMEWAETGKEIEFSIDILNKGMAAASSIKAELLSLSEGLEVLSGQGVLSSLKSQEMAQLKGRFKIINRKEGVEIAKFLLTLTDGDGGKWEEEFELRFKDPVSEIVDFVIADGKEMTVIEQAVQPVTKIVGLGNGDGIANPGETIVILVKDGDQYYQTYAYTTNPVINPNGVSIRVDDPWQEYDHIGGSFKYMMPVIDTEKGAGEVVNFYIEYWVPGNLSGQHIIKKGKVRVRIKGEDTTPPQVQYVQLHNNDRIEARIYDGQQVEKVTMTFTPNEETSTMRYVGWDEVKKQFEVQLYDNGENGDVEAGDGIFSRQIRKRSSYFYNISMKIKDGLGNEVSIQWPEVLFLKDTY